MKVLIFGGTGAMGTPLVKYLVDSGNSVFVTTRKARLSTGNIHYITGNAKQISLYKKFGSAQRNAANQEIIVNTTNE